MIEILEAGSEAEWIEEAVARIAAAEREALASRDEFRIVLSGGSTPRKVLRELAARDFSWGKWKVWQADERCAPEGDPLRNSEMIRSELIEKAGIPEGNFFGMRAERGPIEGARDYGERLKSVGEFDLCVMGLGEDGHTASLFPGEAWGEEADAPAALAVFGAPKEPSERVSLSARRLSESRAALFLVSGAEKRDALWRWMLGERLPAGAIRPREGVCVLADPGAMGG